LLSDVCTGVEVVAEDCQARLATASADIQKMFGQAGNAVKSAVHASTTAQTKKADLDLWFTPEIQTSAVFSNCTLAVIKPHVVAAGQAGEVINAILEEGFEISAM